MISREVRDQGRTVVGTALSPTRVYIRHIENSADFGLGSDQIMLADMREVENPDLQPLLCSRGVSIRWFSW
ncbi:MAG TPA: hypothetical protein VMF91_00745 [Bryobacteraceae bacterium]|nr:hypothetical protein [Bryobacteraceae bacterium]